MTTMTGYILSGFFLQGESDMGLSRSKGSGLGIDEQRHILTTSLNVNEMAEHPII
jgi:hypothetical protein